MKNFIITSIFLVKVNFNVLGNGFYKDTIVIYKTLPHFFYTEYNRKNVFMDFNSNDSFNAKSVRLFTSEAFLTRDALLSKINKNSEITNLITNFFSLEDEYITLNKRNKSRLYFYIYLPENYSSKLSSPDSTIESEVSYLDVGDYYCTFSKKSILQNRIIKAIRSGRLTQKAFIPPFNLAFNQPKKLEYYYTYSPEEDEADIDDVIQDYHISDKQYKNFQSSHKNIEKHANVDGDPPPRRLVNLSQDSINILSEKTNEIIQTYKYFVRQFLTGQVMLRALPASLSFHDAVTYYTLDNLPKEIIKSANEYIDFDKKCRIFKVVLNNRLINIDTTVDTRSIQSIQGGYNKLFKDVSSIKIIYVNNALILNAPWSLSFIELKSKNQHFKDSILHKVFYSRNSLVDDINSINYIDPDLKNFQLPILLKQLNASVIRENYALLDSNFKSKIKEIKPSYGFFDSKQLWVQTDVNNQVIYISPFLIRAAFTTALEKFDLFSLAYNQDNLKDFFENKGKYISAEAIDNIYNERVYNDYTNTIKFVTGHEIAHIYLKDIKARDKESLCDCYAIYHLKKENKHIETGVFETLLVKSVNENAVRFWGDRTNSSDILKRYDFIKNYTRMDKKLSLSTCDALFR